MTEQARPTAAILTLGCRVNQYESQAIAQALEAQGITVLPPTAVCDFYVVNTCAVTSESGRKSRQMIHRLHKQNPCAKILVTGCEAQRDAATLFQTDGVDSVYSNRNKMAIVSRILALLGGASDAVPLFDANSSLCAPYEPMHITASERTRAYVKIEDGCNGKCAYCIIPALRGAVCSRPMEDTVKEIEGLAKNGYREVVLTGIETAAYQYGLGALLCRVNEIEGIERIRLGSMDPAALTPAFIDTVCALSHFMPHFHLSLQSGCDATLHRMRRRYNCAQVEKSVAYLRQKMPDVMLSADVIVGFPGETDADFDATYDFLQTLGLYSMHVFPYSKRPGTEAASMPNQVQKEKKVARAKRLEELARQGFLAQVTPFLGQAVPVLFEQCKDGYAYGHTENFVQVCVKTDADLHNQIRNVLLCECGDGVVMGEIK